jgi:hypothetical protein
MTMIGLLSRKEVQARLLQIFPQGMAKREHLVWPIAASTIFTALYIGAIEGAEIWLAPKHVYRMTVEQSEKTSEIDRLWYASAVIKPKGKAPGERWYEDNTRESIRDDTLREAFVVVGAVIEKLGVATTSSKGRYALQASFAALFDPALTGSALDTAISAWRTTALSPGALARIALVRGGAAAAGAHDVTVTYPNGETRRMKPGPSSIITKAVIETFAKRFLGQPAVLFVSESSNKVVSRDDALAKSIGLKIEADKKGSEQELLEIIR